MWSRHGRHAAGRRTRVRRNWLKIVYPIQDADLRRSSDCETWKRHYSWHTRAWAFRALMLRRYDISIETDLMRRGIVPECPIYNMDDDTAECDLLRLVEPEDLPREPLINEAHADEVRPVTASHEACGICHGSFISDNPGEMHQAGEGGLRQIPCTLKHIFCLDCIRGFLIRTTEVEYEAIQFGVEQGGEMPAHRCPFCRTQWDVYMKNTRGMKSRIRYMYRHYNRRMLNSFDGEAQDWDKRRRARHVGSYGEYVGVLTVLFMALPTFHAVSHSMSVWPRSSHNGGKLPLGQLVFVALLGTVFQAVWLAAILLSPVFILAWMRWRYFKRYALRFRGSSSYVRSAQESALWLWDIARNFLPDVRESLRVEWEAQAEFWEPIFRSIFCKNQ
jgi:hypothetical protein